MAGKTGYVQVKNQQGDIAGEVQKVTFDGKGKLEYSLKNDETLLIYGLNANAAYAVTESEESMPKGFTLTAVDGNADTTEASGRIEAGAVKKHTFVNTYDVTPTTVNAEEFAKYRKDFDNWEVTDSF